MNTIADEWQRFADLLIPDDAPEPHRMVMQIAFFAGVSAVFQLQFNMSATASDDAGVAMLEGWYAEVTRFHFDLLGAEANANASHS